MARLDFHETADRAAALVSDAAVSLRELTARGLPEPHRRQVISATARLEDAQRDLFHARNDPYGRGQDRAGRGRQMEML